MLIFPFISVVPTASVVKLLIFTASLNRVVPDALTVNWRSPVTVLLKMMSPSVVVSVTSACNVIGVL